MTWKVLWWFGEDALLKYKRVYRRVNKDQVIIRVYAYKENLCIISNNQKKYVEDLKLIR